ncbi:MAG: aspartate-semialdehyde dehydrogenase [Gemmatimonadetes bacterium]|nr:aspartate-semialdehyde dehydrogenase [Gemmatimonadota bacterium]
MTRRGGGPGREGAAEAPKPNEGGRSGIPTAVLGATGIVGQRLVRMLAAHPWFGLEEVTASPRREGRPYGEDVPWVLEGDPPEAAIKLRLKSSPPRSRLVLSALPSGPARELELDLARRGHVVCTNASAHRLDARVPLVVPEVNPEALREAGPGPGAGGCLIANPNCVVTGLALALWPLQRQFGIEAVTMVTLQALSGAGLSSLQEGPGPGGVVPWIRGEEEKFGPELRKILGADFEVAASVTRVPVVDGHTAQVFVRLRSPATPGEAAEAMSALRGPVGLPSLPRTPVVVRREPDRPQPGLDINAGKGMTVTVGRLRRVPGYSLAMTVVSHNGIRGAAGACLANAELARTAGLV